MFDKLYDVCALPPMIHVGHQTEEGVCVVEFDISKWLAKWPDLQCYVIPTRPGESRSYSARCIQQGNTLRWIVSLADTGIAGTGKVEILGLSTGTRKLSPCVSTYIEETSTDTAGEVPEALQPWVDAALNAARRAEDAVDKMPVIGENGNWMLWNPDTESFADSGFPARGPKGDKGDKGDTGTGLMLQGSYDSLEALIATRPAGAPGEAYLIDGDLYVWSEFTEAWVYAGQVQGPQGDPGIPGYSPTVSVTSIPGGHRVAITTKESTQVFNVMNGVDGDDGDDGVGIATVEQTTASSADGGTNVLTVTKTDGSKSTFLVKNGSKGSTGKNAFTGAYALTIPASAWVGSGPFVATVACSAVTASNHLVVGSGGEVTVAQQKALVNAMIICTKQATGSITLTAYGKKPVIGLPVNVMIVG